MLLDLIFCWYLPNQCKYLWFSVWWENEQHIHIIKTRTEQQQKNLHVQTETLKHCNLRVVFHSILLWLWDYDVASSQTQFLHLCNLLVFFGIIFSFSYRPLIAFCLPHKCCFVLFAGWWWYRWWWWFYCCSNCFCCCGRFYLLYYFLSSWNFNLLWIPFIENLLRWIFYYCFLDWIIKNCGESFSLAQHSTHNTVLVVVIRGYAHFRLFETVCFLRHALGCTLLCSGEFSPST